MHLILKKRLLTVPILSMLCISNFSIVASAFVDWRLETIAVLLSSSSVILLPAPPLYNQVHQYPDKNKIQSQTWKINGLRQIRHQRMAQDTETGTHCEKQDTDQDIRGRMVFSHFQRRLPGFSPFQFPQKSTLIFITFCQEISTPSRTPVTVFYPADQRVIPAIASFSFRISRSIRAKPGKPRLYCMNRRASRTYRHPSSSVKKICASRRTRFPSRTDSQTPKRTVRMHPVIRICSLEIPKEADRKKDSATVITVSAIITTAMPAAFRAAPPLYLFFSLSGDTQIFMP